MRGVAVHGKLIQYLFERRGSSTKMLTFCSQCTGSFPKMRVLIFLLSAATLVCSLAPQRLGGIISFSSPSALRLSEDDNGGETTDVGSSSFAQEWKKQQAKKVEKVSKKRFAIVGGGWGGWGAAKALCEADDVEVTLLDALPDPTGKTPFLSKTGKPGLSLDCAYFFCYF